MPWARLAGIGGMILVGGAMAWLTSDPAFGVDPGKIVLSGLRFTDAAAVRRSLLLESAARPATVAISTRSMEAAVEQLPTVASARVRATLPDRLTVTVIERQPILAWRVGDQAWLMDEDGVLFAPAAQATADELGDGATGSRLPAVDDQRAEASLPSAAALTPPTSRPFGPWAT